MTVEEKIKCSLLETAAAAAVRHRAQPQRAARNLAETAVFLTEGLKGRPEKIEELGRLLQPSIKEKDVKTLTQLLCRAVTESGGKTCRSRKDGGEAR
ncbi:MAG: hypothetical protein Q4G07_02400 [Oscillospiraceae bacterium]|nr:hypothetical protein [Oscillospiraceae bacterium]